MNDSIKLTGRVTGVLLDQNNTVIYQHTQPNLVVNTGKQWVANLMVSAQTYMDAIAIGTASNNPSLGDLLLYSEVARVSCATSISGQTITYTATFPAGVGTGTIQEAGIFNSTSANSGIMLARTIFPPVNKQSGNVYIITWEITIN